MTSCRACPPTMLAGCPHPPARPAACSHCARGSPGAAAWAGGCRALLAPLPWVGGGRPCTAVAPPVTPGCRRHSRLLQASIQPLLPQHTPIWRPQGGRNARVSQRCAPAAGGGGGRWGGVGAGGRRSAPPIHPCARAAAAAGAGATPCRIDLPDQCHACAQGGRGASQARCGPGARLAHPRSSPQIPLRSPRGALPTRSPDPRQGLRAREGVAHLAAELAAPREVG